MVPHREQRDEPSAPVGPAGRQSRWQVEHHMGDSRRRRTTRLVQSRASSLGIGQEHLNLYRICRFCSRDVLAVLVRLPGYSTFSMMNFACGLPMAFLALSRCWT